MKRKCLNCKQVKQCRNYPYNAYERLGWLCYRCFREIDSALCSVDFTPHDREDF